MRIPKPEFPRPEKRRERWLNLNGEWDFMLFPEGQEDAERCFAGGARDYARRITVPFSWVCPLSGVEENCAGVGWYRRRVEYARTGRLFLIFGAVDYRADVYVNGALAGSHEGGYSAFELEVTALWRDGLNTVEVRAEDYRRETQLYGKQGYGEIQGIWQTVWLEDRPEAYIRDFRIETALSGDVRFCVSADAPDGTCVDAEFDGHRASGTVQDGCAEFVLHIREPRLWSPEEPNLYEGALRMGGDAVYTYFGVREIRCEPVAGREYRWILLNGKPVYLNGTLDQAFHPEGHFTYPSDEAMRGEALRLKRLGLNMVRIHIKAEEPRKLYWMDRLGLLVMEDIPCFWGEPVPEAREAYERQLPEIMLRDVNHPSTFAWVVFNESWGLLSNRDGEKVYLPETQEWVERIWNRAKEIDPTRIVEDNSPCRYDHVKTDLNTWHYYINGYELLRDHVRNIVENTRPGSCFNYIGGRKQADAPLMNSECGMVWGVDGSAGDSDLAWQYHYMMNEYRLHEKITGFVFTEFHDVVNEFNGYYRIDDTDKDFGYQDFCRGMSIRDLHAPDFVAVDAPPMQTVSAGDAVRLPLVLSSFTDAHHGEGCEIRWELWHDGLHGRVSDGAGALDVPSYGYGANPLGILTVAMPQENAAAVLSLYLTDRAGRTVSRNFVTFDVRAPLPVNQAEIPVAAGEAEGFSAVWRAMGDEKLCLGGSGSVKYRVEFPDAPVSDAVIHLEAGSKRVLKKDAGSGQAGQDLDFMRGYLVDRGAFRNSYWMTDESRWPSSVEVLVDGVPVARLNPENDWADARGMLSWHRQENPRLLDEAGSYGEQKHIRIPSRLLPGISRAGGFTLEFRVEGGGLALYGRHAGRYPHGILLEWN